MPSIVWNFAKPALRHFRRQKLHSSFKIVGLAMGLAAFSLGALTAHVGFHYDAFHENSDRIYGLVQILPAGAQGQRLSAVTPGPLASALLREFPEVEESVRFVPASRQIVRYEAKRFNEDRILYADPGFLSFFSFGWKSGDKATALADPASVVLTETTAVRYFGEADAVGRILIFPDGRNRAVSGVLPDVPFDSSIQFDFLIPLPPGPEFALNSWRDDSVSTFVRLKRGLAPAGLEAKFSGLVETNMAGRPESPKSLFLLPLTGFFHRSPDILSHLNGNSPVELYIALAFGIIFLLLVVFNYTSLSIAGSLDRIKEAGIRQVVGSGRRQLFGQFVAESVFFAFLAWALSWPVYEIMRHAYASLFGEAAGASLSLPGHPWIVLFGAAVTIIVGVVSGLYPAALLAAVRPARILKGDLSSGKKGSRVRKALMTVQFVIAIFLVLSSIAVRRQSVFLLEKDLGFDRQNVLVVPVGPEARDAIEPLRNALLRQTGITHVSGASFRPVKAGGQARLLPEGAEAGETRLVDAYAVDNGFLETMGIQLEAGRMFSRDHADAGANRWILNETAARMLGGGSPLGRRLTVNDQTGTVIGVVRDFHFKNLIFRIAPSVIVLEPESNRYLFVKHAASLSAAAARDLIERQWDALAPHLPFEARPLDMIFEEAYGDMRNVSLMFGAIGLLTIAFSCLGMLGLVSFVLHARTKEIGIRKILGASAPRLLGKLLTEFGSLVLVADIVGVIAACFAWARIFDLYAYSSKIPVAAYLLMSLASLAIVGLTILSKTWSAARKNPVESLKYE